jgi:hypothetical protein
MPDRRAGPSAFNPQAEKMSSRKTTLQEKRAIGMCCVPFDTAASLGFVSN